MKTTKEKAGKKKHTLSVKKQKKHHFDPKTHRCFQLWSKLGHVIGYKLINKRTGMVKWADRDGVGGFRQALPIPYDPERTALITSLPPYFGLRVEKAYKT